MAKLPVTMTFNVTDNTSKAFAEINQRLGQLNAFSGKYNKVLDENKAKLKEFTSLSQTLGSGLMKAGAALTAGITLPVIGFGVAAVKAGANYEQAMNDLQARTQSSTEDMGLLSAEARRLGLSTVFGASDASKAMTELGKAGFNTQQIIGSTASVLNLAAAESLDMGAAATLVSDTINQFGLKADDATRVVDMLGKAAGISSIDIGQLQYSLKYAAPEAARFGIKLEEVSAAIAQLGSRGIKSEMAGTSLRAFFNSITADTEKQNKLMKAGIFGKDLFKDSKTLKSLPEMLGALKKANLSATQLTEIFGVQFSGNIAGLIQDSTELGLKLGDIKDSAGFEADVASARTKGWNGEVTKLKNAFEELFIEISYGANGENSPLSFLTGMVGSTRELVNWFRDLSPAVQTFGLVGAVAAAAIGPLVGVAGTFLFMLPQMQIGLGIATGGFYSMAAGIGISTAALSGLLLGIPALIAAGIFVYQNWEGVRDLFAEIGNMAIGIAKAGNLFGLGAFLKDDYFKRTLGNETSVKMPDANFDKATSGLGGFQAKGPSFDAGNFSQYYSNENPGQKNLSEVLIKLGGFIPPGTTTSVSPNSDAFVTLDMGRAMQ